MKQKKLRSLSAVLLIGWCLIFLRCETTEKSMVRALYLAQKEQSITVGLLYQAPEAAADASEASGAAALRNIPRQRHAFPHRMYRNRHWLQHSSLLVSHALRQLKQVLLRHCHILRKTAITPGAKIIIIPAHLVLFLLTRSARPTRN